MRSFGCASLSTIHSYHIAPIVKPPMESSDCACTLTAPHADRELSVATFQRNQMWFPAHVYACWPGQGAVLLDLKRNRYFGLGEGEAEALSFLVGQPNHRSLACVEGEAVKQATVIRLRDELTAHGLLTAEKPTWQIATASVDVTTTLDGVGQHMRRDCVRIGPHHIWNHAKACVWSRYALRFRPFYSVVRDVSQSKVGSVGGSLDTQLLIDLVCIFERLRTYTFTSRQQCLFHALALVQFLSAYGLFPTWVIGVNTNPWGAHSWVQHGKLILDSVPEDVCEYTPILAI